MDIMIVAQYIGNIEELNRNNNRFLYLANLMRKEDVVEIVTTKFVHAKKRMAIEIPNDYMDCKITALEEVGYKRNVSIKRILSNKVLANNLRKYLEKRKKPDLIYCAVPSLDYALVAAKYAKKNNIKFVVDIQDLWPEAYKMVFNIPIITDIMFYPMKRQADKIYSLADTIVGVSEAYCERAKRVNKRAKSLPIYIGTDLKEFDKCRNNSDFTKSNSTILAYCGSLSDSYDLKLVLEALHDLYKKNYDIEFWIMGDGPKRKVLEEYSRKYNLKTVFWGRLDYREMCKKLIFADMCINPICKGSAASIINKHADYAAAGVAVINTQESEEYRFLIEKYECGINCKCGDVNDVSKAIEYLYLNQDTRIRMGRNSRKMAEELFDRNSSYINIIEQLENNSRHSI